METKEIIFVVTSHDNLFQETKENLDALAYRNCIRFSSGRAVLEFAKYNTITALIIDSEIEDMTVPDFISALREIVKADCLHILVIALDHTEAFVLSAISAGCSGLVLRPYTLGALDKYMSQTRKMEELRTEDQSAVEQATSMIAKGRYEEAIGGLKQVVSQQGSQASQANDCFFRGCQFLVQKKWTEAIHAFNQSLTHNQTFIKAYEGLAKAYQGKNDMERYTYYLKKAADEYAQMNNFAKVRKIFIEIVKFEANAPNPYNTLGIRLRQEKQYKEAIQAYFRAIELSPKDENIYYNLAKAYHCDNQPEKSLKYIKLALSFAPEHLEALKMFQALTGSSWENNSSAEFKPALDYKYGKI